MSTVVEDGPEALTEQVPNNRDVCLSIELVVGKVEARVISALQRLDHFLDDGNSVVFKGGDRHEQLHGKRSATRRKFAFVVVYNAAMPTQTRTARDVTNEHLRIVEQDVKRKQTAQ
jgi:hypothetical protein